MDTKNVVMFSKFHQMNHAQLVISLFRQVQMEKLSELQDSIWKFKEFNKTNCH